jgi:hypothetical protein
MKTTFVTAGAVAVIAAGLLAFAARTAVAATPTGPSPKTPHKASSFVPHPTNRRVFGDPIQPPILGHVAPKKPPPK